MHTEQQEDPFDDSNSLFSNSNFLPLTKRDTNKKSQQLICNTQEKIDQLEYQIVEELTIITPLEIHPSRLCEEVETFYYQRKLPSVMEHQLRKRQEREKIDFIMALTSLFRKSFGKISNKYTIVLPNGGIVYFLMEDVQHLPLLIIASHSYDFSSALEKEGVKYRNLPKKEYQRQRIIIEGQYIKLFYGYFLNWLILKNLSIEIFSNFMFDYAFREPPMLTQLIENRPEYQHLHYREETPVGEKLSKVFMVKMQSMWSKEDIKKIEERIRFFQQELQSMSKVSKIVHDYQFKICKFTVDLVQDTLTPAARKE